MKYQNLVSFKKHLVNSSPDNLCKKYLVIINDDFERTKAIDAILSFVGGATARYSGVDCDLLLCIDAMQSMSLLGESIVVLDEVEKLTKKQMQVLSETIQAPTGTVIFGSRSKSTLSTLIEKEGVILDLLEEKPWDKEKRLADELVERAKLAGKRLNPDVTAILFERLGVDPAILSSEIDKIICYVGDRAVITKEDVLAISPASKLASLWQIAEDVIWEGGVFSSIDSNSFHALVPALRGQLHLGMTLSCLIEERCPSDQWSQYLPKIWPKTLEKRSSQAARLGSSYFRKGLEKLFEIELQSRSTTTQYRALLDMFRGYLNVR